MGCNFRFGELLQRKDQPSKKKTENDDCKTKIKFFYTLDHFYIVEVVRRNERPPICALLRQALDLIIPLG